MAHAWSPIEPNQHQAFMHYEGFLSSYRSFAVWPTIEELNRSFEKHPVQLRQQSLCISKRMRRRHKNKTDHKKLKCYDEWITDEKIIPTREKSWHDFFNAMIWYRFPIAKQALYAAFREERQRYERLGEKNGRTREQDLLTLFDEGGCIELRDEIIIFGHAVFEQMAIGQNPSRMFGIKLDATLESLDEKLAEKIRGGLLNLPKENLFCGESL